VIVASIVLVLGWMVVILRRRSLRAWLQRWWSVVRGKRSIVGLYPSATSHYVGIREGLVSLPLLVPASMRSDALVARLNEYYVTEYSPALDVEILVRSFQQRNTMR
jgi:lipopolysaccharide/colanic/teichoic acid biosynthesis glycosyltransferase